MASTEDTDIQGLTEGEKTWDPFRVGGDVDNNFWINSIGLGYQFTSQANLLGEKRTHHQAFASYLVHLPVDGLSAKAVYGFGRAHVEDIDIDSEWENSMHSVRLRLAYEFQ